jgi:hypothetical protein
VQQQFPSTALRPLRHVVRPKHDLCGDSGISEKFAGRKGLKRLGRQWHWSITTITTYIIYIFDLNSDNNYYLQIFSSLSGAFFRNEVYHSTAAVDGFTAVDVDVL